MKEQVLVIEDDHALNEHVCEMLTDSGYRVSNAFTGEDGLRIFSKIKPDFVLLDVFMPGKDGLETLLEMRREFPETKIIVTSGKQHLLSGQSLKMAEKIGADATLAKPFTGKELLSQVRLLSKAAKAEVSERKSSKA